MAKRQSREDPIQKACHEIMVRAAVPGCVHHSIVNESKQSGENIKKNIIIGANLKAMGRRAGVADYLIIWNGLVIYIEFKCPKDYTGPKTYQGPKQKAFEADVIAAGGFYFVVRSTAEFIGFLTGCGLPLDLRAV